MSKKYFRLVSEFLFVLIIFLEGGGGRVIFLGGERAIFLGEGTLREAQQIEHYQLIISHSS